MSDIGFLAVGVFFFKSEGHLIFHDFRKYLNFFGRFFLLHSRSESCRRREAS